MFKKSVIMTLVICVILSIVSCNSTEIPNEKATVDDGYQYYCVTFEHDAGIAIKELNDILQKNNCTTKELEKDSAKFNPEKQNNPIQILSYNDGNSHYGFIYVFEDVIAAKAVFNDVLHNREDENSYFIPLNNPAQMLLALVRLDNMIISGPGIGVYNALTFAEITDLPKPIVLNNEEQNLLTELSNEYVQDDFVNGIQKSGLIAIDTQCDEDNPCSPELFLTTDKGMVVAEIISPEALEDGKNTAYRLADSEKEGFAYYYTANGYLIKTILEFADIIVSSLG